MTTDNPWEQRSPFHHQQPDNRMGEILVAAWMADSIIQNKLRADQLRVEEDVVRRGRAAWRVWELTGQVTSQQLQQIAEAEHVIALWDERARQAAARSRFWRRFWAVVLLPAGVVLAAANEHAGPLILTVVGVLLAASALAHTPRSTMPTP